MGQYFLANDPGFGPISWLLLLTWLISLGGGLYLYQMWREANPVRARFVRQAGLGLAILGAVGVVVLALKAFGLPVVSWRLWTYIVVALTVAYVGYIAYFATQRLPSLLATTRTTTRQPAQRAGSGARTYGAAPKRGGARTYGASGNGTATSTQAAPAQPRPVATTTRRESRRDRKRRSR